MTLRGSVFEICIKLMWGNDNCIVFLSQEGSVSWLFIFYGPVKMYFFFRYKPVSVAQPTFTVHATPQAQTNHYHKLQWEWNVFLWVQSWHSFPQSASTFSNNSLHIWSNKLTHKNVNFWAMSTLNDREVPTSLLIKAFKSLSEPFAFIHCKNILLNYSYFYQNGWKWRVTIPRLVTL